MCIYLTPGRNPRSQSIHRSVAATCHPHSPLHLTPHAQSRAGFIRRVLVRWAKGLTSSSFLGRGVSPAYVTASHSHKGHVIISGASRGQPTSSANQAECAVPEEEVVARPSTTAAVLRRRKNRLKRSARRRFLLVKPREKIEHAADCRADSTRLRQAPGRGLTPVSRRYGKLSNDVAKQQG